MRAARAAAARSVAREQAHRPNEARTNREARARRPRRGEARSRPPRSALDDFQASEAPPKRTQSPQQRNERLHNSPVRSLVTVNEPIKSGRHSSRLGRQHAPHCTSPLLDMAYMRERRQGHVPSSEMTPFFPRGEGAYVFEVSPRAPAACSSRTRLTRSLGPTPTPSHRPATEFVGLGVA